jgi:hypothetical protein
MEHMNNPTATVIGSATERVDRRHGEQAGADRTGSALKWSGLQSDSRRYTGINRRNRLPPLSHQSLHRASEDERTVRTACLKPVYRMGPYMAEGFLRTATRRISSWPGETTLHKKAGYIDADFLLLNTFPLQSDGGLYISETTRQSPRPQSTPSLSQLVTNRRVIQRKLISPERTPSPETGGLGPKTLYLNLIEWRSTVSFLLNHRSFASM